MKKIIITFLSNPTFGDFCKYTILYNNLPLIYANGLPTDKFFYQNSESDTYGVKIGVTMDATIQNVYEFLISFWQNPTVYYVIVGNTIEIQFSPSFSYNAVIENTYTSPSNTLQYIQTGVAQKGLIYYLVKDSWRLEIYKKSHILGQTEVFGNLTLTKSNADTPLSPLRGTGLNFSVESSPTLDFADLSLAKEGTYTCILKKSNAVVYRGILKPDGITQSYTRDLWYTDLTFVDGLGLLEDLSFVDNEGFQFTGLMSMYDVIYNCLNRTKIQMTINTACKIAYNGYVGNNILKDTYVNTERFYKDDRETLMTCQEVLKSVLDIFSLVITQEDGQWWLYRLGDSVGEHYINFINQSTLANVTRSFQVDLGSQIDDYYPHHCNDNQQIMVIPAVSAYTINYKYGFVQGFMNNKYLTHGSTLNYPYWAVGAYAGGILINNPQDAAGAIMISQLETTNDDTDILTSTPVAVVNGSVLQLVVKCTTTGWKAQYAFEVKRSDGQWLDQNGTWVGNYQEVHFDAGYGTNTPNGDLNTQTYKYEFNFTSAVVDADVDITVVIRNPIQVAVVYYAGGGAPPVFNYKPATCEITYLDLLNISGYDGKVGEFHAVQLKKPISSIGKNTIEIFNGDSIDTQFVGAIYKSDQTVLTSDWTRVGKNEMKPILRISAEDDLRISQKPAKEFTGSVFGYLPYLSLVKINNFDEVFTFLEWKYNIFSNTIDVKLIQVFGTELNEVIYNFTYDYNSTVKPSIIG